MLTVRSKSALMIYTTKPRAGLDAFLAKLWTPSASVKAWIFGMDFEIVPNRVVQPAYTMK
jgi:hypothetical protein